MADARVLQLPGTARARAAVQASVANFPSHSPGRNEIS
jgi:hypothetical protein